MSVDDLVAIDPTDRRPIKVVERSETTYLGVERAEHLHRDEERHVLSA